MHKNSAIIVTGAAGFIGSCMVSFLNKNGYNNIILVDDFSRLEKDNNLLGKKITIKVDRENLLTWLEKDQPSIDFVYHLGARTNTTEFDYSVHQHFNVDYSKMLWKYCAEKNIPFLYASSAATYGDGKLGYDDDHKLVNKLQPLNPYGISKNEFDKWVLEQIAIGEKYPPFWAGLKFFNVFGPNEYHKGRMASVIFHAYRHIKEHGFVKLFRSNTAHYKDGEQLRDFVYVMDVLKVSFWFMENYEQISPGLYNLGTGEARSFNDLVNATFQAMDIQPSIEYIDMPADLQVTYQNYTQANMKKLIAAGYTSNFYTLEEGVDDYLKNYLGKNIYF